MPINLQGSGNIAEGWGKAPDLDAPALGPLVASILANKLARDKMLQEGIGETIKNVREERQSAKYIEALKAAGLVSQDYDAGGMTGAKLGTGLAKMIQDQQEFQAREEHRRAMEARVGGRGGRGSRGDGGVTPSVSSAEPQTVWKDGVEWRPGPGGRWIPMKAAGGTKAGGQTDNVAKDVKEALGLQDQFDILEGDRKKQEAEDITAGAKDKNYPQKVPFKQSDLYNMTANRLKELRAKPGMPSTQPQGVPQRPPAETGGSPLRDWRARDNYVTPRDGETGGVIPSDKAGGHAESYGVPPVGTERGGYRFKGGDPKDPNSWEKI